MTARAFDCVLAVDRRGGIGKGGDLPWPKLPADLAFFARITTDAPEGWRNAVIMGSRTWRSIPPKFRPLPRRLNLVITRRGVEVPTGVEVAHSLDEALDRARDLADVDRLFVVGGGEVYREAFVHPDCQHLYVTRLDADFECDTVVELPRGFACAEVLASHEEAGVRYTIERWEPRRRRPAAAPTTTD